MKISLHSAGTEPVISISSGQIRGRALANGRAEFLGIAYAQPPVADLRWHEPVPAKPWSGIRDAKEFGAPCAQSIAGDWNQHDAETSKEDCLFLNVMTPQWPPKQPLPVMLWFHGGGNSGGTASSALYKDGTLVEHGIVLVTANYRLGIFGFFAHPDLTRESPHHSSGNYALLDQIAALKWTRENIAEFGGDPKNITVFGQSAGALDMGLLMTSPLSKDLFHRAIAESGTVLIAMGAKSLSTAEQDGEKFAAFLKAPTDGAIKYLRQLSVTQLLESTHAANGGDGYQAGPIIDGWILPRSPVAVFASGDEAPIAFITGNNSREFDFPASPDELRKRIGDSYRDLAPRALQVYGLANGGEGNSDTLYGSIANQWSADVMFRCPSTAVAAWHNAAHHPTYEYQFERAIPGQEASGSVHSADLPYVFGFYPKTGNISGPFGETDFKIADLVEKYWTNFAKNGNPNGEGLPLWPEFDGKQSYVSITNDAQVVARSQLRDEQCQIYRESIRQHLTH